MTALRFLFLIAFPALLSAQQGGAGFRLLNTLPAEAAFFTVDKIQQLYLVTPANEIVKYSSDGVELFRYNNDRLGPLDALDVTNPFILLLFYPELQTAITLDRTLSARSELTLWNLDLNDVKAVAMSNDNNIWIYDSAGRRLRLIDQNGRTLQESADLGLLLPFIPAFSTLVFHENFLYANDPGRGLLIFDNFGQYVRALPILNITDFQVMERQLLFRRDGSYFLTDLLALKEQPLPLPEGAHGARQVRVSKNRLYVLKGKSLEIYGK